MVAKINTLQDTSIADLSLQSLLGILKHICVATTLNVLFNETGKIPWAHWEMDRPHSLSCRDHENHRSSSSYHSQQDSTLDHSPVARACWLLSKYCFLMDYFKAQSMKLTWQ